MGVVETSAIKYLLLFYCPPFQFETSFLIFALTAILPHPFPLCFLCWDSATISVYIANLFCTEWGFLKIRGRDEYRNAFWQGFQILIIFFCKRKMECESQQSFSWKGIKSPFSLYIFVVKRFYIVGFFCFCLLSVRVYSWIALCVTRIGLWVICRYTWCNVIYIWFWRENVPVLEHYKSQNFLGN